MSVGPFLSLKASNTTLTMGTERMTSFKLMQALYKQPDGRRVLDYLRLSKLKRVGCL